MEKISGKIRQRVIQELAKEIIETKNTEENQKKQRTQYKIPAYCISWVMGVAEIKDRRVGDILSEIILKDIQSYYPSNVSIY